MELCNRALGSHKHCGLIKGHPGICLPAYEYKPKHMNGIVAPGLATYKPKHSKVPDTFWLTDSRIKYACMVLGWEPYVARNWAQANLLWSPENA